MFPDPLRRFKYKVIIGKLNWKQLVYFILIKFNLKFILPLLVYSKFFNFRKRKKYIYIYYLYKKTYKKNVNNIKRKKKHFWLRKFIAISFNNN